VDLIWHDFQSFPLWLNLALFAVGGLVVWATGTRLAGYADSISERTGLGRAFVGALFLGGLTSLPEVATTITASLIGNVTLAVNNIFGGVAMQVAILVIADLALARRALSASIDSPLVLLQGMLSALLLALAACGIVVGEPATLPVGLWSLAVLVAAAISFSLMHGGQKSPRWQPKAGLTRKPDQHQQHHASNLSNAQLAWRSSLAAVAILAAGFVVARSGDAIALQTGLGAGFVGFTLVAISTSLPEVSTTLSAVRFGGYSLAFSNIFGTNVFDLSLLFLADVAYAGGPVLNHVGSFSILGALLGIAVTTVYMAGIIERRNVVLWRVGPDSLLVAALYAGGLFLLYHLSVAEMLGG
jgi:cation:H+ antiporter